MAYPKFLEKLTSPAPRRYLDKAARGYRPMLGIWLIDLALILEWYLPRRLGRWPSIFSDDGFCLLTFREHGSHVGVDQLEGECGAWRMPFLWFRANLCSRWTTMRRRS